MMSRKNLSIFFITYVAISFFLSPFEPADQVLFFSSWKLFARPLERKVYDLSCKGEDSFVLRDERDTLSKNGMNLKKLDGYLRENKIAKIKAEFKTDLQNYCHDEKIFLVKMNGTLSDYIILKKKLEVYSKEEI